MKKGLGAAVIAIWILSITGCGSAAEEDMSEMYIEPAVMVEEELEKMPDDLGTLISDQTFEVTLNGWGEVTFASYAPKSSSYIANGQTPDVRFGLVEEGQIIYEFPGGYQADTGSDLFLAVSAISFKDYNDDGLRDVITICEYETMSGDGYQLARVYYQLEEQQGFEEDVLLTQYLSEHCKTETIAAVLEVKEAYREYADSLNGQQDIYAQIAVIAREKALWAAQAEYAGGDCQYAVADLDRNGRYEIIVANMGGTGMYTYSSFWEINEQYNGLTECETDFPEGDSQPDLIAEEWETYTDDTGRKYYAVYDLSRNGAAEYYENIRVLSLQKGKIVTEPIAYRTTVYSGEKFDITCKDASGGSITEKEYEGAAERYFKGYQNSTTILGWQELQSLSDDETELKKQLKTSLVIYLFGEIKQMIQEN